MKHFKDLPFYVRAKCPTFLPAATVTTILNLYDGSLDAMVKRNEIIYAAKNDIVSADYPEDLLVFPTIQFHNGGTIPGYMKMLKTFKVNSVDLLDITLRVIVINGVEYDTHFDALRLDQLGYFQWLRSVKPKYHSVAPKAVQPKPMSLEELKRREND